MICLACIVSSIMRGNMSIAILAMTKPIYNTTVEVPDVNNEKRIFKKETK